MGFADSAETVQRLWRTLGMVFLYLLQGACTTTAVDGEPPLLAERAVQALGDGAVVVVPDGNGPFPVVVAFHGCGGVGPVQEDYARVAQNMGVMTVIVDSYGPRKIGRKEALATVCSGVRLRGRERAGDVIVALEFVRRHPDADARRVALLGWSHGAWSIMDALALNLEEEMPKGLASMPRDPFAGVEGAVLLYPYCGFLALTGRRGWLSEIPAQFILAAEDEIVGIDACISSAERLIGQGLDVQLDILPGQTHGFDEPDQPANGKLRYDPQAAARAQNLFGQFLREHLHPAQQF